MCKKIDDLMEENAKLKETLARVEAVRKDAGRYRWLRENDAHPADWDDAAIDAAMRAQAGEGGQ